MASLSDRLSHAWNAFLSREPTNNYHPPYYDWGMSNSTRPDRQKIAHSSDKFMINAIYNRIALDVAAITIEHVRLDDNDRFVETLPTGLNNCLTLDANVDQTGRAFIQDVVLSMFDEGCVAIVPTDTTVSPEYTGSFDVLSLRTGKIVTWYPEHVRINVYNEKTGLREDITMPKKAVAIVENPLYAVMNETNSTLKRLIRKLNTLDVVDEQSSSGKLDLIIQLPYSLKTQARKDQAEIRRKEIETQLINSKYGIAYMDSTEHITQLNRPVDNNLMGQVEYLTNLLYSQLGLSPGIFDGTADEKAMLNYHNRTIEPILSAITDEMKRKFLTKTARTQKQSIVFFRDPFKLVAVNELAEVADKFTRNEIMTSNELRQIVGLKPSSDPEADELRNKNLNRSTNEVSSFPAETEEEVNYERLPDALRRNGHEMGR